MPAADPAAGETPAAPTHPPFDLVLFGATGFTGRLVARYLDRYVPPGCQWALAGRDREKLAAVRAELAAHRPPDNAEPELPLLEADVADPASLHRLASRAKVVISTVGPYLRYGEPLVAACAENGTDYLDLAGEPEFVDSMYVRHHDTARRTGARLVHACGFDSVPYDLGVLFTVGHLPEGVPLRVDGYVHTDAAFSGGTFASALGAVSRGPQMLKAARERRQAEPPPSGDRRVSTPPGGLRHSALLDTWGVQMPTIDPQIVARSAAALDRYGPDFRYRQYAAVRRLPLALGGVAGAAGLIALAQVPPVRRWLSDRTPPGEGPSVERRARSTFSLRFLGEGGGHRVATEVAGGDPGYDETAKIISEAALCLAFDPGLPSTAGQVTTAAAMGDALTRRLMRAGLTFRVTHTGRERPAGGA
ncbi:saccharopine dehydrogenase [Streptomyces armeniacus]|uniref:Saccharopine dehydrogenase n=1 Tax=Streptomyces armeniacus TaxID=83291 RepID=A0A345Y1R8_9ACTN|nr:saccharopine dehydrogenase NADP-binding domain-containing protein [Streptomyces armeniacus]AXK37834.1 saccharopine dehydrogenase [Streptomyces armeniacus]